MKIKKKSALSSIILIIQHSLWGIGKFKKNCVLWNLAYSSDFSSPFHSVKIELKKNCKSLWNYFELMHSR